MSVAEMKKAINEKVEKMNEEQLKVFLKILEKSNAKSEFNAELFFEEVVAKYGNVLEKLAQ